MPVHAVKVEWATHRDRLRAIRARVFIEEQGVPKDLEWDGLDESAEHFIALNEAGVALGTARLLSTGQIGRMAVLAEQRGRGIGRQLLETAVSHAVTLGMPRVFLHAQRHAEGFYRKSGFAPTGAETVEAGIEHVEMDMILPIPFEPSAPSREPSDDQSRQTANRGRLKRDQSLALGTRLSLRRRGTHRKRPTNAVDPESVTRSGVVRLAELRERGFDIRAA